MLLIFDRRGSRWGEFRDVAWGESSAIVFANSVLGARTHRYGDFIDICAALTGRAPAAGFHLDEARAGTVVYEVDGLAPELASSDVLAPVLGYLIGADCGAGVPVIDGLPAGRQGTPPGSPSGNHPDAAPNTRTDIENSGGADHDLFDLLQHHVPPLFPDRDTSPRQKGLPCSPAIAFRRLRHHALPSDSQWRSSPLLL